MNGGRIPRDLLYGELSSGNRNLGRPRLRYRDMCKRDMKKLSINKNEWDELGTDRSKWSCYLQATLKFAEKYIITALETNAGSKNKY